MKNNVFMNAISSIFFRIVNLFKLHTNLGANLVSWILIIEHAKAIFKKLEYRYFTFYVTYSIDGKETYKITSFCNTSLNIFPKNVLICHIKRKIGASLETFFFRFRTVGFPRKVCQNTKIDHKKSWIGPILLYSIFLIHTNSLKCCSFKK